MAPATPRSLSVARQVVGRLALVAALAPACASARHEPFAGPVGAAPLDAALEGVDAACAARVRASFESGARVAGCVEQRRRVARALIKSSPRRSFGLVDQRGVDLRGVSLVVVEARGCHEWPLRAPGYAVLTRAEARASGCRLERYSGPLQVTAIEPDGTHYPGIVELEAVDGVLRVSFTDAEAVLRGHGFSGLDQFARLELGRGGWAGTVNLARLREFLTLWHFVWVVRGRGAPGLFAALHPDHARAGDARALTVEGVLSRQERDYLAVARGALSPQRFLDRYVWSPYRPSVAAMAGVAQVPSPEVRLERTAPE